jgi:hypothetical protein
MGDEGTLLISESASKGEVHHEPAAPDWDKWVKAGLLMAPVGQEASEDSGGALDVRETMMATSAYRIPVQMDKKYHQPHLENFFDAVRGKAKLNCPSEVAYESAVTVLKVNEAVEAARKLGFKPEEFRV